MDDPTVVCRCGEAGCLEPVAGGGALSRDGLAAVRDGRSPHLAQILAFYRTIEASDVVVAAAHGDPVSMEMPTAAGRLVCEALATLVSYFNRPLVIIGGGVTADDGSLLAGAA
jgi:predicted NBD/HSP70 family sugar kinase